MQCLGTAKHELGACVLLIYIVLSGQTTAGGGHYRRREMSVNSKIYYKRIRSDRLKQEPYKFESNSFG